MKLKPLAIGRTAVADKHRYTTLPIVGGLKVSFFGQCSKMQLIPLKSFNIKTCFIQFLWFFRLKC